MAVSTSSYFNNAIAGQPQAGFDADVHEVNSSPKFPVGQELMRSDGVCFRYAHFGAAVSAGMLVAQDYSESSTGKAGLTVVAPASAQAVPNETANAGDTKSRYVEITAAGVTLDEYAGGYLCTVGLAGEGQVYRIKGNTATNTPTSGNFRLELYKPLKVALEATSEIVLMGSKCANLEAASAATDYVLAGVSQRAMTAGQFGWVQINGLASVLQDGSITASDWVTLSDGVSGAVQAAGGGATGTAALITEALVGYCVYPNATTTDFAVIDLQLQ